MVDIKNIKKIDNQITFAIGHRNLFNIIVVAVGFCMAMVIAGPIEQYFAGLTIFIIGLSNAWQQTRDNFDTIDVVETEIKHASATAEEFRTEANNREKGL